MKGIFSIAVLLILASCSSTKKMNAPIDFTADAQAIEKIMRAQEIAWSQGDVDEFMKGYWESEKLSFGGKKGFTYGFENVKKNYKRAQPNADVMGKVTFDISDLVPLNANAAYVLGKYNLVAKDGPASGYFTLVWKKIDGAWKIVSDHTSG